VSSQVLDQRAWASQLATRYAEKSPRSLDSLPQYVAFAHLKFAVIAQGVTARVAGGAMAGQDFGNLDAEIERIAAEGLELLI
jgi:hypothetical protein